MMKSVAFLLSFLFFLSGGEQEKYFPDNWKNISLGLPKDSVMTLRKENSNSSFLPSSVNMITEEHAVGSEAIKTSYLFDRQNKLYEVIIEYPETFPLDSLMLHLYGPPNFNQTEWLFTLPSGTELYIWRYLDRLCIADGAYF